MQPLNLLGIVLLVAGFGLAITVLILRRKLRAAVRNYETHRSEANEREMMRHTNRLSLLMILMVVCFAGSLLLLS